MIEREVVSTYRTNLFAIDKLLTQGTLSLEEIGNLIPTLFYVSHGDLTIDYINQAGCDWVGLTVEQIRSMGNSFLEEYFHPDTISSTFPRLRNLYQQQEPNPMYCDFQRILDKRCGKYKSFFTVTKFCEEKNVILSLAQPMGAIGPIARKLSRILEEEAFMREHSHRYERLTDREREVIRLLGKGYTNPQIADRLFISRKTVEQHRKNINSKLDIKTFVDVIKYVQAFDLDLSDPATARALYPGL